MSTKRWVTAASLELARVIRAASYSWRGLLSAYENEAAFRLEVVLFALLAPVAMWLGEGPLERTLMIASLLLVLIVELLNSAVEAVVDRFGTELNELSGRAKDISSAAVMLAIANVAVVWAGSLWP